jgi:hypothetical protein
MQLRSFPARKKKLSVKKLMQNISSIEIKLILKILYYKKVSQIIYLGDPLKKHSKTKESTN